MQLYSQFPVLRARQILADVIAVAIIVVAILAGVGTASAVAVFGEIGASMQSAGDGFGSTMSEAADTLGGIPLIGEAASSPFADASAAGEALAGAGRDQQVLVSRLSVILGVLVTVIPVAILARVWLRRRVRFARTARAAHLLASSVGGRNLLALRALETLPAARLAAIDPDPAGQWRVGHLPTIDRLAGESLRQAGIRPR